MFQFIGNKLFGSKKPASDERKHRLTVSIPSTKYDPPSKHYHAKRAHHKMNALNALSLKSTQSVPVAAADHCDAHKHTKKYKPKSSKGKSKGHQKSKSHAPVIVTPHKPDSSTQHHHHLHNMSPSYTHSSTLQSTRKQIFHDPSIFHANCSLKFEITVQYQSQTWSVYKTLHEFITLHQTLVAIYGHADDSRNDDDDDVVLCCGKTEVPPLLPLGLFYLYFDDPLHTNASASVDKMNGRKPAPQRIYKQIYRYHQQQTLLEKRDAERRRKQEQQQQQQQQHLALSQTPSQQQHKPRQFIPYTLQVSSSVPLQYQSHMNSPHVVAPPSPLQLHHHPQHHHSDHTTTHMPMPTALDNMLLFRNVSDTESPFLKHMRLSLQVWLRVIADDAVLMECPELSSFIQFRWLYEHDKPSSRVRSEGHHHHQTSSSKHNNGHSRSVRAHSSRVIVGGHHAPDAQSYFDKMSKRRNVNGASLTSSPFARALMMESNGAVHVHSRSADDNEDDEATAAEERPALNDFTLLKVIGKGAFGKVLQVRKVDEDRIYAMKILKKENVIKRNQIEHTKTERRVLGYVQHPFIVSLYYAFQTDSKLYLVLDYCGGGELFFHLGKAGRFKEGRARFYAASITLALEYLHAKNIIYRDLKPENVLLDNAGFLKLTDFGLSKEHITDFNLTHSFCGTPEYLAPEILRRCGHGRPADWWSLGALLYEMMTGMPPFYSRDRDRLFEKILHSKLRFPNYFSDAAVNLLTLLMQRNWKKRLGSYQPSHPAKYERDPKKQSFAQLKGAQQIKRHLFFREMDWKLLYEGKLRPPYVPHLDAGQTNNFDEEFTGMPVHSDDANQNKHERSRYGRARREKTEYLLKFESFSYVRDESGLHETLTSQVTNSDEDDDDGSDGTEYATDDSTSNSNLSSDSDDDDDDDDDEGKEEEEDDEEDSSSVVVDEEDVSLIRLSKPNASTSKHRHREHVNVVAAKANVETSDSENQNRAQQAEPDDDFEVFE